MPASLRGYIGYFDLYIDKDIHRYTATSTSYEFVTDTTWALCTTQSNVCRLLCFQWLLSTSLKLNSFPPKTGAWILKSHQ